MPKCYRHQIDLPWRVKAETSYRVVCILFRTFKSFELSFNSIGIIQFFQWNPKRKLKAAKSSAKHSNYATRCFGLKSTPCRVKPKRRTTSCIFAFKELLSPLKDSSFSVDSKRKLWFSESFYKVDKHGSVMSSQSTISQAFVEMFQRESSKLFKSNDTNAICCVLALHVKGCILNVKNITREDNLLKLLLLLHSENFKWTVARHAKSKSQNKAMEFTNDLNQFDYPAMNDGRSFLLYKRHTLHC